MKEAARLFFLRHPRLMNLWFPFLGARIRVRAHTPDLRSFDIVLKRSLFNSGYSGAQFGGSLFAMTDPWYMFMLSVALGKDYIIWDKAASIRYRRPGLTDVRAHFELTHARLAEIKLATDRDGTHDAIFPVEILDPEGQVIATVERVVYIATKAAHKAKLAARQARS